MIFRLSSPFFLLVVVFAFTGVGCATDPHHRLGDQQVTSGDGQPTIRAMLYEPVRHKQSETPDIKPAAQPILDKDQQERQPSVDARPSWAGRKNPVTSYTVLDQRRSFALFIVEILLEMLASQTR